MTEAVTTIVGEEEGVSQNPQVQEELVEKRARDKGWKPQEEWKGNAEDWVSPKEYLGREKLFDRIRDLKGEVSRISRKTEQDVAVLTAHFEKVREADYQRAREELRSELRDARRADDVNAEEAAELKLEKLETERQRAQQEAAKRPQNAGPTPEFQEWQESNQWFQSNTEMQQEAIAIGTGYAAMNPTMPQKKVLEHVSKQIKKLYPEEFGDESAPSKQRSAGPVESGDGGRKAVSNTTKKKGLSVADLDSDQVEIMKVLIKRGALKARAAKNKISQEEQYLQDVESYEARQRARR